MTNTLCKGIRKDGSPCRGQGLDQYDGLCIAHGPAPDQAFEWRSQGGKNSATAARLDKRIPERLKDMLDILDDGMQQVVEGSLSPARFTAVCRGVKMKLDVYGLADRDMDLIRAEEIQAAAAAYLDANANIDLLEAADDMAARQDRYRAEALVDQDYAEVKEPLKPGQPPQIVLNDKGRRRFGYRTVDDTQRLLNEVEDELTEYDPRQSDLSEIAAQLQTMQQDVEETLSALARDDVAPFDPLTRRAVTELPAGVQTRSRLDRLIHDEVKPRERLQEQLSTIKQLMRQVEELAQAEDAKQEPEEAETCAQEPEEAETCAQEPEEAETCAQEPEEAETYGQEPEEAETCAQEPEEAETYGQEPEEAETCAQEPEEAETCAQEPEEAETCAQELEETETYAQEPEETATYGPEQEVVAAYGQEPEEAESCGPEPEESETSGQEPQETETCRQEPEEAQQGSEKLQYFKESLQASGIPIESVPAQYRWQ